MSQVKPLKNEVCCVSEPKLWKRDALLFDRIYVPSYYVDKGDPVPESIAYGSKMIEADWKEIMGARAMNFGRLLPEFMPEGVDPDEFMQEFNYFDSKKCILSGLAFERIYSVPSYSKEPMFYNDFSKGVQIAYDGALNNLPLVDSETTSWDQIIEFRSDLESVRKYRDLRMWLHYSLSADSLEHATHIISQKIEDYNWAIQKHGLKTKLGIFTNLVEFKNSMSTATAVGAAMFLSDGVGAAIAGGLIVGSQAIAWMGERMLELKDIKRNNNREIAILYDAQKKFKN